MTMSKINHGFAHILLFILILAVIAIIGVAGMYVTAHKTTLLDNGYSWSTMKQGPYKDKVMYLTATDPYSWSGKGTLLS